MADELLIAPLKLWFLMPRQMNAPPFDRPGVAHTVFVVAPDEQGARALAFVEIASKVWGDPEVTLCVEFKPRVAGVVVAVSG